MGVPQVPDESSEEEDEELGPAPRKSSRSRTAPRNRDDHGAANGSRGRTRGPNQKLRCKSRSGPEGLFGMLLEASVNVPGVDSWHSNPRPAVTQANIRLTITKTQPETVTLELARMTPHGPKSVRLKEVHDLWLAVHKPPEPQTGRRTRRLADALRCRPLTKLPTSGVILIRSKELVGLPDALYVFTIYSQHRCIAETKTVERGVPMQLTSVGTCIE